MRATSAVSCTSSPDALYDRQAGGVLPVRLVGRCVFGGAVRLDHQATLI
jgi:hypothetical protein